VLRVTKVTRVSRVIRVGKVSKVTRVHKEILVLKAILGYREIKVGRDSKVI